MGNHISPHQTSSCFQLAARQLIDHLSEWKLLPELQLQSTECAHHSTATVVLRILSDIFAALDRGALWQAELTFIHNY